MSTFCTTDFAVLILTLIIGFFVIFGQIWLYGSVITSGIKAVSGACGQTYGVEAVLSGDWFCPPEEK